MSEQKPATELGPTEIISLTFRLYRKKFLQFFVPFLVQAIVLGTITYVITTTFPIPEPPAIPTDYTASYYEELLPWFYSFFTTVITVGVLSGLISWIVSTTTTGVLVKYTSDQIEKGNSSLSECLSYALSKLPALLPAQLISGILIVIGLVFFVVPGIILAIMFSLIIPAIMIEGTGAFESISRSRTLVKNRWQNTFILGLILGMISVIATLAVMLLTLPLTATNLTVDPFISNVTLAVVGPLYPIAITYLYYAMKAKQNPEQPTI
ncbi:MAG: hypothetical protein NWF03_07805 [Candidatus Bathyarchaeota archaeon]|nr:hypothetical protein [Candidatus Bathyarchaeota archaeon]